jgi:bifunctional non-homologous end joining protein LigD
MRPRPASRSHSPSASESDAKTPAEKLRTYRSKRDFAKTPEPSGALHASDGHAYLIQKHAATRLHYDFRLELGGVLLSWSVPKGPTLKAGEKRLAVRTEDHPLEYGDFEGVIPKGEYGGGTVLLWDRGSWEPEGDAAAAMRRGRLTFELHGQKLHGKFHLVRTGMPGPKENWLLFKARDAAATDDGEIVETQPLSVTSGRSIEEIAGAQDRVWYSNHEGPSLVDLVRQLPTGVALTNLDRVLFPEQGVTKAALIAYYASVSEPLLARIARRPLAVVRCPEGRTRCFFWKNPKADSPRELVDGKFLRVEDQQGLIALGQLGALELHTWGCHVDDVEHPDELVIGLDPDEALPFSEVVKAAREVRERLKGLECFVKTTGGKGVHVVAPIAKTTWAELEAFTRALAKQMHADAPGHYSATAGKKNRVGKIFVDSLRNVRGATAVGAYSPRARAGAPVSMPVSWDELESVKPRDYTLLTVPTLVAKRADPWAGYVAAAKQTLPAKAKRRQPPAT